MSELIVCDKCGKISKVENNAMFKLKVQGHNGHSKFHICERCLSSFYLDFLNWTWNMDEEEYKPREVKR